MTDHAAQIQGQSWKADTEAEADAIMVLLRAGNPHLVNDAAALIARSAEVEELRAENERWSRKNVSLELDIQTQAVNDGHKIADLAERVRVLEAALKEIKAFTEDTEVDDPMSYVHATARAALASKEG